MHAIKHASCLEVGQQHRCKLNMMPAKALCSLDMTSPDIIIIIEPLV